MNIIELFSGSGTISKEFASAGHNVFSIDIRRRKGICEPDLRKNILHVRLKDIPFKKVHVIWASPPCDVFSKAGANFHWNKDGTPKTEKCLEHIKILKKCLVLIEKISPDYFFIENPDGKMKYQRGMVNFLIRNHGKIIKLNYRDYGFGTLKPTTIFTNALNYFGKSVRDTSKEKNVAVFDNLTKCQKQAIPDELAKEIREYCEINRGRFIDKNRCEK